MKKESVKHPERNPDFATGAFSDGIIANGFLFISGQAAVDFESSAFKLGTIEEETRLTLDNLQAIAQAAGASLEDAVKCQVYLADIRDFAAFNVVYAGYFKGVKPARTTVQAGLANGIKIEIDCIIKLP